jgi:nucleoside-diphosphate-sugar epimerase
LWAGRRLRIRRGPAQAGDARPTGADGTGAEVLLGYRPAVSLADGIADQAAWVAAELGLTESRTVGT